MTSNEWPLVFFTLLSQISVGVLLSGFAIMVFAKNCDLALNLHFRYSLLLSGFIFLALASVLSFLHLVRPGNSVFAFSNLANSKLSQEILLMILYWALIAFAYFAHRTSFVSPTGNIWLNFLVVAVGVLFLVVMSRVYMLPTIPPWNTPLTPIRFFASSALLGAGFVILLLVSNHQINFLAKNSDSALLVLALLMVLGTLAAIIPELIGFSNQVNDPTSSFQLPQIPTTLILGRVILLIFGIIIFAVWYIGTIKNIINLQSPFIPISGFIILFASEIIGRWLFYSSYYRIGI